MRYLLCPQSSTARVRVAEKDMGIKKSNNFEVLAQQYCTILYTQLYEHTQNC